jgi:hypothetical protein
LKIHQDIYRHLDCTRCSIGTVIEELESLQKVKDDVVLNTGLNFDWASHFRSGWKVHSDHLYGNNR